MSLNIWAQTPLRVQELKKAALFTPGKLETLVLRVENPNPFQVNCTLNAILPANWQVSNLSEQLLLEPKAAKNLFILLKPEITAPPGDTALKIQFTDEENNVSITKTIYLTVDAIHDVQLSLLDKPKMVVAGNNFRMDFEVKNYGNAPERLKIYSSDGRLFIDDVYLQPGESKFIPLTNITDESITHQHRVAGRLMVQTEYTEEPVSLGSSVVVYPKANKKTEKYHRLPVYASVQYMGVQRGEQMQNNFQYELRGNGTIDRFNLHHIDFTFRGPNRFSVARIGNYDQYSVEYTYKKSDENYTKVKVGDFSYNLTNLTEAFRWGRGVEIQHKKGKLDVGAFYNQPRFFQQAKSVSAAYAGYQLKEYWRIQLSGLSKVLAEDINGNLGSVLNEFEFKDHKLGVELSLGTKGQNSGSAFHAYAMGRFKGFNYTSQTIYASKDYAGYYSNGVFSNNSLNYRKNKWGLLAGLYYNATNPALDTLFTAAPYTINYRAGVQYFPSKMWRLQTTYQYRFKEDRFTTKKFLYREQGVRQAITLSKTAIKGALYAEFAQTQNLLIISDSNTSNSFYTQLQLAKTFWGNLTVGAFGQYALTNRYDASSQRYVFYGGNVSAHLRKWLNANMSYRNNYFIEEYARDRSLIEGTLTAAVDRHTLSIRLSKALQRNTVDASNFFISAKYTIRLDVPTAKNLNLYTLNGKFKSNYKKSLEGVILTVGGNTVVSDRIGAFQVHDLSYGPHVLDIDKSTLPIGYITSIPVPTVVEILPNEENAINISIIKGAEISGTLTFTIDERSSREGLSAPIKVIKATNGDLEYLTYTDENGNFNFKGLTPGEWKVRLVKPGEMGNRWEVVKFLDTVILEEGKHGTAELEVRSRQRSIKFSGKKFKVGG